MKRIRVWIFRQKFRFDLGMSFLSIVNFALLVLATKSKILVIESIPTVAIVIAAVLLLWLFGFILDHYVKSAQMSDREGVARSLTWQEHIAQMNRIENKLD